MKNNKIIAWSVAGATFCILWLVGFMSIWGNESSTLNATTQSFRSNTLTNNNETNFGEWDARRGEEPLVEWMDLGTKPKGVERWDAPTRWLEVDEDDTDFETSAQLLFNGNNGNNWNNGPMSFCWDWVQDAWEECDDWNLIDWDGCSSTCLLEVTTNTCDVGVFSSQLTDIDVLPGATDVVALMFDVETFSLPETISSFIVLSNELTSQVWWVSTIHLWNVTDTWNDLLVSAQVNWSPSYQLDFADIMIPANSIQRFMVTYDIADNAPSWTVLSPLWLLNVMCSNGSEVNIYETSDRTITITWIEGELYLDLSSDFEDFYKLWGLEKTDCVAEFDVYSEWENIYIEGLSLDVVWDIYWFVDAVDNVILEWDNGEIYTEVVSNEALDWTVEINIENNSLLVTSTPNTLCLQLWTKQLGFNTGNGNWSQDVSFSLKVDESVWEISWEDYSTAYTNSSSYVAVKPVLISDLDLLPGSSSLSAAADIAKIKLTTDSWINRSLYNTTTAKLELQELSANVFYSLQNGSLTANDFELSIDGGSSSITASSFNYGVLTFDLSSLAGSDIIMNDSDVVTMTISLNTFVPINSDNDSVVFEYDETKDANLRYSIQGDTNCSTDACIDGGLRLGMYDFGNIITD